MYWGIYPLGNYVWGYFKFAFVLSYRFSRVSEVRISSIRSKIGSRPSLGCKPFQGKNWKFRFCAHPFEFLKNSIFAWVTPYPNLSENPHIIFSSFFTLKIFKVVFRVHCCPLSRPKISARNLLNQARKGPTHANCPTKPNHRNWKMRRQVLLLSSHTLFWSLEFTEPKNKTVC